MFPEAWLKGVKTPMLEDLLCLPVFCEWARWVDARGFGTGALLGANAGKGTLGRQAAALAAQRGVLTSKHALPALLERGAHFEAQFAHALDYGRQGLLPWDRSVEVAHDLRFAAAMSVERAERLREARVQAQGALRELSSRCRPLTEALIRWQSPSVHSVAGGIHVGLVAVLCILARWPDRHLAQRFVTGFAISGILERTGIYEEAAPADILDPELLFAGAGDLLRELSRQKLSEDAQFLRDACKKEHARGWAGPLVSKREIDAMFGVGRWAPIPTLVVTQSSGKKRPIHNGRKGGHNDCTAYAESMSMCSAFQPAVDARVLAEEADSRGVPAEKLQLQSGGDDMPDAFRSIPVLPDHLPLNVAAVRGPDGEWSFQSSWAMLFGFSASVLQFDRWSAFIEAVARRLCMLPWSMYVDDGHLTDLLLAEAAGQELAGALFEVLGTPLAPKKRQAMSAEGEFLGLVHSFRNKGAVQFWPKESLVVKASAALQGCLVSGVLAPGDASKLRGLLTFMGNSMWHGVGRAAMRPLKQRQYTDAPPWELSNALRRSTGFFLALLQEKPCREVPLRPVAEPMIVVASDARADESGPPSGARVRGSGQRSP